MLTRLEILQLRTLIENNYKNAENIKYVTIQDDVKIDDFVTHCQTEGFARVCFRN